MLLGGGVLLGLRGGSVVGEREGGGLSTLIGRHPACNVPASSYHNQSWCM